MAEDEQELAISACFEEDPTLVHVFWLSFLRKDSETSK